MWARVPGLMGVGLTLLLAAWLMSTPLLGGPDETDHYLRAVGIANGNLVGPRVPFRSLLATPKQADWMARDTRGVVVPARFAPPNLPCVNGHPDLRSSCLVQTGAGDFYPLPYLLPAVAVAVSNHERAAARLSRDASALESLAFILLAVALTVRGTAWSLLGLLAAVTPTVLFISSLINPDGLELAASLAFLAAVLRLARGSRASPTWVWVAAAVSGAVTILSWQLGLVFVAGDIALLVALLRPAQLRELVSLDGRRVRWTAFVLAVALVLYVVYGRASGVLHSQIDFRPVRGSLQAGIDQLGQTLRSAIGTSGGFGQVNLPSALYWIWWLVVLLLSGGAALVSDRREQIVFGCVVLAAFLFPVLFFAGVQRNTGFGMQGRYVLPVLVSVPMLAGHLLDRFHARVPRGAQRSLLALGFVVLSLSQLAAWWAIARQSAGGTRVHLFLTDPLWSPPLGWAPWAVLAILGTVALVICALDQLRASALTAAPVNLDQSPGPFH